VEQRRDKIDPRRERRRHEAARNAGAALSPAGPCSGADTAAAPLLGSAGSARRRARLRRWPRRRRRPGRPGRPVRPAPSPAGKALRLLHAVRAGPEAAAWPRQARVRSVPCPLRVWRIGDVLLLIVVHVCVSMVQEDQAMPVHQPGVRVHQPAGIFRLLRLPAAHPGIIRRGQGRRRKPPT
jgi:hypothetical protein